MNNIIINFKITLFAVVVPFDRSLDEIGFTYKIPVELEDLAQIWKIVNIPFWRQTLLWIIVDILEYTNYPANKLKSINSILDYPCILSSYQIEIIKYISSYYYTLIHNSLWIFIPSLIKSKLQKNTFDLKKDLLDYKYKYNNKRELNKDQVDVFKKIIHTPENKFLLFWITWSWKTEVYINLIKHYIDLNKQVLMLVPEIILTNQLYDRIKNVFWNQVEILNSSISAWKKEKIWKNIYSNNCKIVIWTRSALFYPYQDLWLIIIDEEHDNSYKSWQSPKYDTIEIANMISNLTDTKLLLWSWTPKIETMYNAIKKQYSLLTLFTEHS